MRPWKSSRKDDAAGHGAARPEAAPLDPRCAPGRGGPSCSNATRRASHAPFHTPREPTRLDELQAERAAAQEADPRSRGTARGRGWYGDAATDNWLQALRTPHTRARAPAAALHRWVQSARSARSPRLHPPTPPRSHLHPHTPLATGPSRDRTTRAAGAVTRGTTLDLGHRAAPRLVETA